MRVRDCFGELASTGRVLFANAERAVGRALDGSGRCEIPEGDWTHVLALLPLHAPLLHEIDASGAPPASLEIAAGPPTLLCNVLMPDGGGETPRLWLEHPWEERAGWPRPLSDAVPAPERIFLPLDPGGGSFHYGGREGTAATIRVDEPYLIETAYGLADSITLAQSEKPQAVVLRPKPALSIELVAEQLQLADELFSMTAAFVEPGGPTALVKRDLLSSGERVELRYHPRHTQVRIDIHEPEWGELMASMLVALPVEAQPLLVPVVTDCARFLVVDVEGRAIEGACVAQIGGARARTGAAGEARLRLSESGDDLVVIAPGYEVLEVPLATALQGGSLQLAPATGIRLHLLGVSSVPPLEGAGILLDGIPVRGAVARSRELIDATLGLAVQSEDSGALTFCLPDAARATDGAGALELVLAGVFDVPRATTADLVILDAFGQEALRQPVELDPGRLTPAVVDAGRCFQTFAGRVLDESGDPIDGAEVWTGGWGGLLGTVVTGPDGRFSCTVSADCGNLTVDAADHVSYRGPWPPTGSGARAVDLVLQPARSMRVQIVDPSGARVQGASLLLRHENQVWAGHESSPGYFEFSSVPRGELQAEIRSRDDGFWTRPVEAEVLLTTLRIAP